MSQLSVSIPDSIHRRVASMAQEDGVSVDAYVATILSQRVAVADADSYVRQRAQRGSAQAMLDILAAAPDVEPELNDQIKSAANGGGLL